MTKTVKEVDVEEYLDDVISAIIGRMREKKLDTWQVCLMSGVSPASFSRFINYQNKTGIGVVPFIKICAALDLEIEFKKVKSLEE